MANKFKQGLEYFSFDVDFFEDEKIEFVSSRFGVKGELITIRLLCKIYRNGYYLNWDEDAALLFAKRVGDNVQYSLVNDVVFELVRRGFFEKSIFDSFNVLTSNGIQKRYLEATEKRKRVDLIKEYWLREIPQKSKFNIILSKRANDGGINPINDGINQKKEGINSQSKVKESKVKERLNYIGENEFSQTEKLNFLDLIIDDFSELYLSIKSEHYEISPKDKKAVGQLLSRNKKYNEKNGISKNSEETRNDLKIFFEKCLSLEDWLGTNCTLPLINSKINEYKTNIKNGKYKNGIIKPNSTSTGYGNPSAETRTTQQNKAKTEPDYSDSSRY